SMQFEADCMIYLQATVAEPLAMAFTLTSILRSSNVIEFMKHWHQLTVRDNKLLSTAIEMNCEESALASLQTRELQRIRIEQKGPLCDTLFLSYHQNIHK
ncbi:unnamed protein product, partial [Didymodactylos carnosus]